MSAADLVEGSRPVDSSVVSACPCPLQILAHARFRQIQICHERPDAYQSSSTSTVALTALYRGTCMSSLFLSTSPPLSLSHPLTRQVTSDKHKIDFSAEKRNATCRWSRWRVSCSLAESQEAAACDEETKISRSRHRRSGTEESWEGQRCGRMAPARREVGDRVPHTTHRCPLIWYPTPAYMDMSWGLSGSVSTGQTTPTASCSCLASSRLQ